MRLRRQQEPWRWEALAQYNSEKARGIAHTPEYAAKMAQEQALFAKEQYEKHLAEGFVPGPYGSMVRQP